VIVIGHVPTVETRYITKTLFRPTFEPTTTDSSDYNVHQTTPTDQSVVQKFLGSVIRSRSMDDQQRGDPKSITNEVITVDLFIECFGPALRPPYGLPPGRQTRKTCSPEVVL
jgi:hypothetical protein